MSIRLTISNSLDQLAQRLAQKTTHHKNVFLPTYIVTQTEGMNSWLKFKLAEATGIAANIRFLSPNEIIWEAFNLVDGRYRRSLSSHELNWLLYKVLDEEKFQRRFKRIADYYLSSGKEQAIKQMALAEKIADLFDQYQIYRAHDGIEKWNEGQDWDYLDKDYDHQWQKYLWKRCRELAQKEFPDKIEMGNTILKALDDPEKVSQLKSNLPHVYFFGLSLITNYHLQIIHHLSGKINIELLIQNPAPNQYWYDDLPERSLRFLQQKNLIDPSVSSYSNPLLMNWSRLIKDTFRLIFKDESTLDTLEIAPLEEPSEDRLLNLIQASIFHNEKTPPHITEQHLKDHSLTIKSCFNPLREVQALYNFLIHLMDRQKEGLAARDIVVQVTNIDLYAPFIRAVFDNAPYYFPYTIADEVRFSSDNAPKALEALLRLNNNELTAENLLNLLDFKLIRQQFNLTDIEQLRTWLKAANIHFGKENKKENDTNYVSWRYGLQRLMYGLCMSGEELYGEGQGSFYPTDLVEGYDLPIVVQLLTFIESIFETLAQREEAKTLNQWIDYVETLSFTFLGEPDNEDDESLPHLQKQLNRYREVESLFHDKINFEVFCYTFLPTLTMDKKNQDFGNRGITFCSLIPMRSIPFKVVALLGMDYDKFPRKERPLSFNLLQKPGQKQIGDRNVKDNDKHLFLETLLSAKDYFYLSYIGQNIKDNSLLPPSIMVEELLQFIKKGLSPELKDLANQLITIEPQHSYSTKYNKENPHLYSYLLANTNTNDACKALEEGLLKEPVAPPTEPTEKISLTNFLAYFKNPFKFVYHQKYGVHLQEEDTLIKETEIFELDGLQNWQLKNDLFLVDGEEAIDRFREKALRLGKIPLKNQGHLAVQKIATDLEQGKMVFKDLTSGQQEQHQVINLKLGSIQVEGVINGIYGTEMITYSFSKDPIKHHLENYLKALILWASRIQPAIRPFLLNININTRTSKDPIAIFKGEILSAEEAQDRLVCLINLYQERQKNILPFLPDFFKRKIVKNFSHAKTDDALLMFLKSKYFESNGGSCDIYALNAYRLGFFEIAGRLKQMQEAYNLLISPLNELYSKVNQ